MTNTLPGWGQDQIRNSLSYLSRGRREQKLQGIAELEQTIRFANEAHRNFPFPWRGESSNVEEAVSGSGPGAKQCC